jgi:hypothetical protein
MSDGAFSCAYACPDDEFEVLCELEEEGCAEEMGARPAIKPRIEPRIAAEGRAKECAKRNVIELPCLQV